MGQGNVFTSVCLSVQRALWESRPLWPGGRSPPSEGTPPSDGRRPPPESRRSTDGQYASCWNAYLLSLMFYTKFREGNFFGHVCPLVSHSVLRKNCPWCIGPPLLIWDLTVWGAPGLLVVTSGGEHWRPFQTCSFNDPYPPPVLPSGG